MKNGNGDLVLHPHNSYFIQSPFSVLLQTNLNNDL